MIDVAQLVLKLTDVTECSPKEILDSIEGYFKNKENIRIFSTLVDLKKRRNFS